jgi:ribosomal-protein-alanine N-acetyltransferase
VTPETLEIRRLSYADLPQVIAIERRAFPTPWSLAMFVLELSKPSGICLAALEDGAIVGYLVCSRYDTVWHLMNVAVDPKWQRQGIATALLDRALGELRGRGVRRVEAWTREGEPANRWYRRSGFHESERYLHVYAKGREEVARAVTAEPGLVPVHAFLHLLDVDREAEMRDLYGRVYICRCYERAV